MSSYIFKDNGERMDPEEVRALALKQYNMQLVHGFKEFIDGENYIQNDNFSASFMQIRSSRYIKQTDGCFLKWRTCNIKDIGDEILFVFLMAMGNMSPLPQVTGHFELSVNGKRLVSFRCVKYREIWEGDAGIRFCFRGGSRHRRCSNHAPA